MIVVATDIIVKVLRSVMGRRIYKHLESILSFGFLDTLHSED
jgi:hypothetical protein